MHSWWKEIVEIGPTFGYYPKPDKSCVIVKTEEMVDQARQIFGDSVKVTCGGERHVGAALGTAPTCLSPPHVTLTESPKICLA